MTRIQMACYGLMGSAFVIGALLVVQMENKHVLSTAQADQVVFKNNITAMTARTAQSEEGLFILDNASQRLLIYQTTLRGNAGEVNLVESIPLNQMFAGGGGAQAPNNNRRRPR